MLALAILYASLVTGCGVSENAHQKVVAELEQTKKKSENANIELKKVKQKMTSLGSFCAEQDKTIQGLNSDVKNAETEIAEKDSKVDRLMNPEEYAFSDAESLYYSSNYFGALSNYKVFVQDFSNSRKVPLAQVKIKEIEQLIAKHKKDEAVLERQKAIQAATEHNNLNPQANYNAGSGRRASYEQIKSMTDAAADYFYPNASSGEKAKASEKAAKQIYERR